MTPNFRTHYSFSARKATTMLSKPRSKETGLFYIKSAWLNRMDALAYSLDIDRI